MKGQCEVCKVVTSKTEQHHSPKPKRLGGNRTITLCLPCHDMVDRINLSDWPNEFYTEALQEIDKSRAAKLLLLKVLSTIVPGKEFDK